MELVGLEFQWLSRASLSYLKPEVSATQAKKRSRPTTIQGNGEPWALGVCSHPWAFLKASERQSWHFREKHFRGPVPDFGELSQRSWYKNSAGRKTLYRGGFSGDKRDFSVSQFTDDLDGLAHTKAGKFGSWEQRACISSQRECGKTGVIPTEQATPLPPR